MFYIILKHTSINITAFLCGGDGVGPISVFSFAAITIWLREVGFVLVIGFILKRKQITQNTTFCFLMFLPTRLATQFHLTATTHIMQINSISIYLCIRQKKSFNNQ